MRHTLFSIYNKVALDIKDPVFKKITKQEYLTVAGEIALDISKESHMFIQQREYIADGGETTLVIHSSHALLCNMRQMRMEWEPKRVYDDHTMELLRRGQFVSSGALSQSNDLTDSARLLNDFVWNYDLTMLVYNLDVLLPLKLSKIPNDTMFKPLYILKAMRGLTQLEEHSYDAVHSAIFHNRSFNNDEVLGRQHYAIRKLNADSAYYAERQGTSVDVIVNMYPPVYNPDTEQWFQNEKFDPDKTAPIVQYEVPSAAFPLGQWLFTADYIETQVEATKPIIYDIRKMHYPYETELSALSESMVLFFAIPLEKGERICIDFVTQMPIHSELHMAYSEPTMPHNHKSYNQIDSDEDGMIDPVEEIGDFMRVGVGSIDSELLGISNTLWVPFQDNTVIPDVLETAFYKGIRWAVIEKIFMQEGDLWGSRLAVAKREYEAELVKLRSYQRNKKDLSSVLRIQPYKFLEGDW